MTNDAANREPQHDLRIELVELVGASRSIRFLPGLNLIRGDITTGKTTLVRLLHALLGSVPKGLPPETAAVRAVGGRIRLGAEAWDVYRPLVTTSGTPVEIAQVSTDGEPLALRLPASGEGGYGEFILTQLSLPIVSVPRARREPTNELSPVTVNDWLLYCIVTGDDLDTQVFGHRDTFRDMKRRWVFEISYGLYDEALAELSARLRRIDLKISACESEAEVIRQFLAGSAIGKPDELEATLTQQRDHLQTLTRQQTNLASSVAAEPTGQVGAARSSLLDLREQLDNVRADIRHHHAQVAELRDLDRQLDSVSKRLTRAIVADEWMVDFDFVVCPRCGHDVDQHRHASPICYLCSQAEPDTAQDREALLKEQDRITFQLQETKQLLAEREESLAQALEQERSLHDRLDDASAQVARLTASFVSAEAERIQVLAAETATVAANIEWIEQYLQIFNRQADRSTYLGSLRAQKLEVEELIEAHTSDLAVADDNIRALEQRMLDYLTRLHVPQLEDLLTVRINRSTYLPEVSTRTFDELSSQGLKTLVNIAHALAHHTVAIDRGLPMPGLLVLDGVSANSGKEGFEGDRVVDMYRLFAEIASEYADSLQLIVVDNDLPTAVANELEEWIVLTLSQDDRLIAAAVPQGPVDGPQSADDEESDDRRASTPDPAGELE